MEGIVLPEGFATRRLPRYYAQHFETVEIDSTFYATPNVSVVRSWNAKTLEGFLFCGQSAAGDHTQEGPQDKDSLLR